MLRRRCPVPCCLSGRSIQTSTGCWRIARGHERRQATKANGTQTHLDASHQLRGPPNEHTHRRSSCIQHYVGHHGQQQQGQRDRYCSGSTATRTIDLQYYRRLTDKFLKKCTYSIPVYSTAGYQDTRSPLRAP